MLDGVGYDGRAMRWVKVVVMLRSRWQAAKAVAAVHFFHRLQMALTCHIDKDPVCGCTGIYHSV